MSATWKQAFDGDVLAALIWSTINSCSLQPVFHDPESLASYLTGQFTDADRRALSVRALGNSLGIDVETTRRTTKRLIEIGACELRPDGIVVPASAYDIASIDLAISRSLEILTSLKNALSDVAGETTLADLFADSTPPWEGRSNMNSHAAQLFSTVYAEYMARFIVENSSMFQNNLVDADIFQCILSENNSILVEDATLSRKYATIDDPVPDEIKTPITVRRISSRFGYSKETIRRHVNGLISMGLVERRSNGYIVPMMATTTPSLVKYAMNITAWLPLAAHRFRMISEAGSALCIPGSEPERQDRLTSPF